MKCEEVRVLLAAYRRSDWSIEEQRAVSQHLATCNPCRRWEVGARRVGEHLRQLPTITPPDSLRERVFAAIQREAITPTAPVQPAPLPITAPMPRPVPVPIPLRPAASVAPQAISPRATTRPLAVATTQRVGEVAYGRMHAPRVIFGKRTAIATIAALFLIMFTARIIPFSHQSNVPAGAIPLLAIHPNTPAPYTTTADALYPRVLSVAADLNQVIYVGQAADGKHMILVHTRPADHWQTILPAPVAQSLTIVALTNSTLYYVVDAGKPTWALQAIPLVDGALKPLLTEPLLLLAGGQQIATTATSGTTTANQGTPTANVPAGTPVTITALTGLWAQDHTVLFTAQTNTRGIILESVDALVVKPATVPQLTLLAQAQTGHTLVHPYLDHGIAYWVDRMVDADGMAHGVIWQADAQHAAHALNVTADAFGPVADGKRLAWFQPQAAPGTTAQVNDALLRPIAGAISTSDGSSTPQTVSPGTIPATQVWRGQGYLVWVDAAGGAHMYVLGDNQTRDLALSPSFDTLALSATSVTWSTTPAHTDTPAPGTILVVDLG